MTAEGTRITPKAAGDHSRPHAFRWTAAVVLALIILASAQGSVQARVLDDGDRERISSIKTSFTDVVTDIAQTAQRPDLSAGDSECMKAALRDLLQISEELKSYEYLITIENQLNEFADENALRGILRFAVDKALKILDLEKRRMSQLSDQCSRYPVSAGKTQRALQFIDGTAVILKLVQPRL